MALQISNDALNKLNDQYEGIRDQILSFEAMELPQCVSCGCEDTAIIQVGVIGRTMNIAIATSKIKLVSNANSDHGKYFCNACETFFAGPKD